MYVVAGLMVLYLSVAWALAFELRRSRRFGDSRWLKRRRIVSLSLAGLTLAIASGATVTVEGATRTLARTEAQRAADAAALAAAGLLIAEPDNVLGAERTALEFARLNHVRGRAPQVAPEDVVIDADSGTVSVRVHARAYGIPPVLAWLLGTEQVTVSAEATAEGRGPKSGRWPVKYLRLVR